MGKVDDRDIYEIKRWLNDDLQNVTVLNQNLSGITVEPVTFTENGTFTAPSGKAYSPVTVNVADGSSDFSTADVTLNLTATSGEPLIFETPSKIIVPLMPVLPDGYYTENENPVDCSKDLTGNVESLEVILSDFETFQGKCGLVLKVRSSYGHARAFELDESNTTLQGDITWDSDESMFIVSGDCTITGTFIDN